MIQFVLKNSLYQLSSA